ncbi:S41 family peptidase [Gallaecimonas sp. GXIMD4217]|uniref:S41 family peptidase n=1 Tax=Gallaecimonas sp. GXIMD4217 TaxID=3131927 RepID=UPI00311B2C81
MKLKTFALLGLLASPQALAYGVDDCVQDLQFLPDFLLQNDTGAPLHWQQKGEAHFQAAMDKAVAEAAKADSAEQCRPIVRQYLKAWRPGHLSVQVVAQPELHAGNSTNSRADTKAEPARDPGRPSLELLSGKTALLTVPSFGPSYREPLEKLLADNHEALASRPNWILDVRHNGGGSDSTYAALLPWLMGQGWREVDVEWLVTPANLKAQAEICDRFDPGNAECKAWTDKIVAAMQEQPSGSYVRTEAETVSFERVDKPEPRRPSRVAVLVSRRCGSSCEQFLLAVRQSFSVKLVGQRSYGALDYSNLRPHLLPSGQLELFYATSRSLRLPEQPVDLAGVIPDVYLDKAEGTEAERAQVEQVKGWLEGGDL